MKLKTSSDSVKNYTKGFRVLATSVAFVVACSSSTTVYAFGKQDIEKIDDVRNSARLDSVAEIGEFFTRPRSVTVNADSNAKKVVVTDGTVSDVIKKSGITLGKDDIVFPSVDLSIDGIKEIQITRIKYQTKLETVSVDYDTKIILSNDLDIGEEEIVTKGVKGSQVNFYTQKLVNGEVKETIFEKTINKQDPVTEIKKVGTRKPCVLKGYKGTDIAISNLEVPDSVKLDKNGIPKKYKSVIKGKATAYTGGTLTSCGKKPMPGLIAVNPKQIPYGSELYIVSSDGQYVYGYSIAADTGGFVKMGNTTIDLYMDNEDMCIDWGNRKVDIYILN